MNDGLSDADTPDDLDRRHDDGTRVLHHEARRALRSGIHPWFGHDWALRVRVGRG